MGQMVVFGFGGALGVTFVSAVIAWVTGGGAAKDGGSDDDDDGGEAGRRRREALWLEAPLAGK